MKTFNELTPKQQEQAVEQETAELLKLVTEGLRFDDELNGDNLQATIDAAAQEAEDMGTPWFAHEYIAEARYSPGEGHATDEDGLWPVIEALRSMAICTAEDAFYLEDGEIAIRLEK